MTDTDAAPDQTYPDLGPDDENPLAGRGSVVLDIGGDIGALIVTAPDSMTGVEVEIRGVGHDGHRELHVRGSAAPHGHGHGHGHGDGHVHDHDQGPEPTMDTNGEPLPHVAVVRRPMPDGELVASLVYQQLLAGPYELFEKGTGDVRLTVDVSGGAVTEAAWPS